MYKFNLLDKIAFILLVIGGIDWGLLGLFNFNLIGFILGHYVVARIFYILIGASAILMLYFIIRTSKGFKHKEKRL